MSGQQNRTGEQSKHMQTEAEVSNGTKFVIWKIGVSRARPPVFDDGKGQMSGYRQIPQDSTQK